MRFAGFIITYERPQILLQTLQKISAQTIKPEKILIVDNSISDNTREILGSFNEIELEYYRVGYNSGPAGAAALGLQILAQQGYDWIYWGDDNDPPLFSDTFERLLKLSALNDQIGAVGAVGQFFNTTSGLIHRVPTNAILRNSYLEVDVIAGGSSFIISRNVVEKGALPDTKIFFGFEELDFCLQIKKLGFKLVVDNELFFRHRQHSGRLHFKRPLYKKKNELSLIREYYSLRNLLIIARKNGYYLMKLNLLIRWTVKALFGFRFGFSYGIKNLSYILKAFSDFYSQKFGETVPLITNKN
ncbi:MAG: glycosyltransferase [Cyclobacteriaceae bacterium]|nr:glycosyltransferase [Cyclobacteriaceae bacterium]